MTTLLIIIYITFISLGLPDAVLGSAWPKMYLDLHSTIPAAGIMTMIVSGGTIVSSLYSGKLIHKFGTSKVTTFSVLLTAFGLLGISFTPNLFIMCLFGIPLGIGAGAVDSGLNNFVALHYKAKHMNWLHCFWGIGATAGPMIMSFFLMKQNGWQTGYLLISIIQFLLVICLFLSFPIWRKNELKEMSHEKNKHTNLRSLIKLPGAKSALLGYFCYCAVEAVTGLWAGSYLVLNKGMSVSTAALWVSLFYVGITAGRFISGLMAVKINNINMIRIGQVLVVFGAILMLIPYSNNLQLIGLILLGLGCAPIYPSMLHETPNRFGKSVSQGIMGIQMATAYIGSTFIPPVVGFITNEVGFGIFPIIIVSLGVLMIFSTENINHLLSKKTALLEIEK